MLSTDGAGASLGMPGVAARRGQQLLGQSVQSACRTNDSQKRMQVPLQPPTSPHCRPPSVSMCNA